MALLSPLRRKFLCTLLLSLLFFSIYFFFYKEETCLATPFQEEGDWAKLFKARNIARVPRIILVWNDLWGKRNWGFSLEPTVDFQARGCTETNCVVTAQRSMLKYADAVIFHIAKCIDRPPFKVTNQKWIFMNHEPPNRIPYHRLYRWQGLFNWTMTYRLDADIHMPYAIYYKRPERKEIDYAGILKRKSESVAWMVSNCDTPSERNEYVVELMKYIRVDIYGKCASKFGQSNKCTREQQSKCDVLLDQSYKFYLSFENCLTKDYVTEKYFNMLSLNIVPVVRGDGDYNTIGPPKSWIDTRDFKSPKDLANFLIYLNGNDEEYIKYLKWKEIFTTDNSESHAEVRVDNEETSYCLLCRKLNNPHEPMKVYNDIKKWYGSCREANDII